MTASIKLPAVLLAINLPALLLLVTWQNLWSTNLHNVVTQASGTSRRTTPDLGGKKRHLLKVTLLQTFTQRSKDVSPRRKVVCAELVSLTKLTSSNDVRDPFSRVLAKTNGIDTRCQADYAHWRGSETCCEGRWCQGRAGRRRKASRDFGMERMWVWGKKIHKTPSFLPSFLLSSHFFSSPC